MNNTYISIRAVLFCFRIGFQSMQGAQPRRGMELQAKEEEEDDKKDKEKLIMKSSKKKDAY